MENQWGPPQSSLFKTQFEGQGFFNGFNHGLGWSAIGKTAAEQAVFVSAVFQDQALAIAVLNMVDISEREALLNTNLPSTQVQLGD